MEELQTYYQIPSIAHFCNLFRDCLNLPDFDYEDLEFAFLTNISPDNSELGSNESNLILRLICGLLKGYFDTHINHLNCEKYLQKLFQIQWVGIEKKRSPFVSFDDNGEEISLRFDDLPLRTKVDVIHCLCDYRLFADDISQKINDINADDYRVEPLGTDNKGYTYWYFYGTRLYREDPSVAQSIEDNYKKYDELFNKRAEYIKRNIELEKKRAEQELKKQTLIEAKLKKEEQRRSRTLPPKVLGYRTGLRERKSEQSVPNGVCTPKSSLNSKTISKSDSNIDNNIDLKNLKEVSVSIEERREAWSLICQTEQDWKDLTETFAKSKNKSESDLYKLLSKNFIPKISEIFETKEKEKQKLDRQKLIELLPRRLSSRIELRKIQKEKEEIEEQVESRRKREELESKSRETDRQRSERIKQEREVRAQKRLQLVEERAERALKRDRIELNNGVDTETQDQNMETNEFDYINEDFFETPVIPTDNNQSFYEGLEKVISNVKSSRDSWPFAEAVDGNKFPMYYQVITDPMDLSIIEKKIEKREYQKFEELENDFKLMVNNCETFNGPKNGYTLMAYGVWGTFKKASLKYLKRELTYNESTAFLYPKKVTNTNIKPAIEAKKKKHKRRSTFKALDVLAEAAEKAVEANDSRVVRIPSSICSSYGESSPNSTLSSDSNVLVKESTTEDNPLKIHGDMWANFLFNANKNNPDIKELTIGSNTTQTSTNCSINENLTFKSLDEWSKSIKQSGNYVVLPQHAVIISSPQFKHCTNQPIVKPEVSLKVVTTGDPISLSTTNVNTNTSNASPVFTSSVISNNENASKELVKTDPKRLVIKLSRCEAQQIWKPVTLITSTTQNNFYTNSSQINGQTITTSAPQFPTKPFKTMPTNCVPIKKRYLIQDLGNQSITEQKPSVAINVNPISQNSKQNSQSFQITGIERNQNSNLKVFHLKKLDQTSTVCHTNTSSNNSSTTQRPVIPKLLLMPFKKQTPNENNSSGHS